jgi:hypothetical protein
MGAGRVASSLRTITIRLSLAALIAAALAAGNMSATPRHASAGAFPALLDPNVGSVMNPLVIHNLYWDTSWNATNPGMSMQQIDDATTAMIASGYLSKLSQYGITSITFSGSNQADPSCGTAAATIDYFDISGFVLCEKHAFNLAPLGSQGVVYMVYAPMSSMFSMLGFTSCTPTAGGMGGFHFQTLPSVVPPDVPQVFGITFTSCTSTLDGTTSAGAHELVEAATDPFPPFDWIDNSVASPLSIGSVLKLFTAAEASDLCESGVGSPAPPPIPPTSANPRVTGSLGSYDVAYYWSNSDGACVPLPHTISLAQTGLPFPGTVVFDSLSRALPFTMTVADGTVHSFSFPSPVPDPANPTGTRFVTSAPGFAGPVTSSVSETAVYTRQFFLTVRSNPAALAPLDLSLTASGWHDAGAIVSVNTDALIALSAGDRYRFDFWSGATPANTVSATVVMSAPQTVTANYVLQHLVTFTEAGIPAGVSWNITVNGSSTVGPMALWFDQGTSVAFSYQTPVADPNPGTRYVLTSTAPPSPIVVTAVLTVVGQYQTQHLLVVSTLGLGSASTTISNAGTVLGSANDTTPLNVWLPDGTALALSADAVVTGAGGVQLFFQGFTPAPPPTLNAPFSTTASYSNIPALIAGGRASGAIDNGGVAHSLLTQFTNAQNDIAAGNHTAALGDLRAFVEHVAAQSGHHVDPALARTLELDALLAYHEQLCAALDAAQITVRLAANDYRWYAARVTALGGTPLPPC